MAPAPERESERDAREADEQADEDEQRERDKAWWRLATAEALMVADAAAAGVLAYVSVAAPQARWDGASWLGKTLVREDGSVKGVLKAFVDEAVKRVGQAAVMDTFVLLLAAALLTAMVESGRRGAPVSGGAEARSGAIPLVVVALLPGLCQFLGAGVVFPLFAALLLRRSRLNPPPAAVYVRRDRDAPRFARFDVNPLHVLGGVSTALLLAKTFFDMRMSAKAWPGGPVDADAVHRFFLLPLIPALVSMVAVALTSARESDMPRRSEAVDVATHAAVIVVFMVLGALSFSLHTEDFSMLEDAVIKKGGSKSLTQENNVMQMLVKDVLSEPPSRFLFTNLVHLGIACALLCAVELSRGHSYNMLVFVAISLVGPTGSYCLLAAVHEYNLMRADHREFLADLRGVHSERVVVTPDEADVAARGGVVDSSDEEEDDDADGDEADEGEGNDDEPDDDKDPASS